MLPSAAFWALAVVGGPLLLSWLNARQRRRERREDWQRQDEVAAKAELVAVRAETVARRAELAVESAQETQHKLVDLGTANGVLLETIHTLVNSNLTGAVQGVLDANVERLATLNELVDLKKASDRLPTAETLEAIAVVTARIADLRTTLADRLRQQDLVDRQADQP